MSYERKLAAHYRETRDRLFPPRVIRRAKPQLEPLPPVDPVPFYREVLTPQTRMDGQSARATLRQLCTGAPFTVSEVVGRGREIPLVDFRHACIVAVRKAHPDLSLPQIGRVFQRDHSTILHALRHFDTRMEKRKEAA